MTKKNINQKDKIYLPIDVYESYIQQIEEYKAIQKKFGVRWVKVHVNKPVKKSSKKRN